LRISSADLRQGWQACQWPLSLVLVLVLWEAAVGYFEVPLYILPPPSTVVRALVLMFGNPLLYGNALVTFGEALAGFGLACVTATIFAVLISESAFCERVIYPYFTALQSMPKVALAPLIVIWFGYGYSSKIVLAGLLALFPMLVNFIQGLKSADAGRLKLMRSMQASRWQTLRHVRLPYAAPFFLAGVQLGTVYAMLGALVGEFVGARAGLGNWLMAMNMNLDTSNSFALLVLLATYGIVVHRLIASVRRKLLFWNDPVRTGKIPE
jgi:NitT/TauT family transport system permease protein